MTFVLAYIIACRYHAVINNDDKNGPTILSRASCWIFRKGKNHTSVTLHTKTTSLTDDLPLTPTVVIWVICHMLPDWVEPSFVIFDIRALWRRLMVSLISQQQFTLSPLIRVVRLSLHLPRVSHHSILSKRTYVSILSCTSEWLYSARPRLERFEQRPKRYSTKTACTL